MKSNKVVLFHCNFILSVFMTSVECSLSSSNSSKFILSPEVCSQNVPLLILVHSAPFHFELRERQRSTWMAVNPDFRTVFVIGHSLDPAIEDKVRQEVEDKKDILFIDIMDSYRNLTLKHMLGYEWAISQCSNAGSILVSFV